MPTRGDISRRVARILAAGVMVAMAVVPLFAKPARACSCAAPMDIPGFVGEADAAFVGTLVDKQDTPDFEAIYVFQVEQWVKGDAGDVVEVRSGQDGGACGFEFWDPDQRIGALIFEEGGELHGGLCSQIEPVALLTAAGEGLETPGPTTPPLVLAASAGENPTGSSYAWLAAAAMASFLGILVWLSVRISSRADAGESDR